MTEVSFRAWRTHAARQPALLERVATPTLLANELLVRTAYAGLNYKDSLAMTGSAPVARSYPRTPGIEFVGTVEHSTDGRWTAGTPVLVHGHETGVAFDGGLADYVRVPAAYATALPFGLDLLDTALLGVPAFTAALALEAFEHAGVDFGSQVEVAVTGAYGAVGQLAVHLFSRAGFRVCAVTRRTGEADVLRRLGAHSVESADDIAQGKGALASSRFAAALDTVGGSVLPQLMRCMADRGVIAVVGNAGGNDFAASVLPFLVRRIALVGVVANETPQTRHRIWQRLATEWKPDLPLLRECALCIAPEQTMDAARRQIAGTSRGRVLVSFTTPPERDDASANGDL